MATAQKRGFHFPWGSEPNRDEPDAASVAERLGAVAYDLGRGPFDLPPASETEPADEPAPETDDDAVAAGLITTTEPESDVAEAEAIAAPATPSDAAGPSAEPVADTATHASRSAWPDSDRRGAPAAPATPTRDVPPVDAAPAVAAPTSVVFPPKRENPLVAGLVRAMRDAAQVARDEAVASLRAEAVTRSESIRVQGTATAAELRKAADVDVAEIREWSKAEMARIREETEARIVARKAQLGTDIEAAGEAVEQLLGQLAATVEAFEAETATFFDHLLAENDPARLAGLAERMPQPPTLDEAPVVVATAAPPQRRRLEVPAPTPEPELAPEPTPEPQPIDEPDAQATIEMMGEADAATEPDALDADAAAEAEAAALAGLDGKTQLVVSGLEGVAAIARFKASLTRTPGVSAVSANAGTDGDVLFTVTHADDADVRGGLREMTAFQTRVIADDGSSLVVVAQEAGA